MNAASSDCVTAGESTWKRVVVSQSIGQIGEAAVIA